MVRGGVGVVPYPRPEPEHRGGVGQVAVRGGDICGACGPDVGPAVPRGVVASHQLRGVRRRVQPVVVEPRRRATDPPHPSDLVLVLEHRVHRHCSMRPGPVEARVDPVQLRRRAQQLCTVAMPGA